MTKEERKKHAFQLGLSHVPMGKQREVEERIMHALNIKIHAYRYRRRGAVVPRVDEKEVIEKIFADYDVPKSKVWGPKPG